MLPSKLIGVVLIWTGRPVRPTQAKVSGSAAMRRKAEKDGVCQDRTARPHSSCRVREAKRELGAKSNQDARRNILLRQGIKRADSGGT